MSEAAGSTRRDGGSETTRTSAAASTGAIRELETVVAECANGRRRVAYAEYGDPDGEAVVVLHGTPGSRLFGALFDDAARRGGVRVLAPDRPGYGRSSPWSDRRLTDTGAFVTSVLDDAGVDRADVVGFSGGGPHALAVAGSHGERVASVDVVSGATPPSLRDGTPTPRRLLGVAARRTPRLTGTLVRGRRWVAEWAGPSVVVSQYTNGERETGTPSASAAASSRRWPAVGAGPLTESRLLAREWGSSRRGRTPGQAVARRTGRQRSDRRRPAARRLAPRRPARPPRRCRPPRSAAAVTRSRRLRVGRVGGRGLTVPPIGGPATAGRPPARLIRCTPE
jgi:pimeloyl-ACP methyl ester carboxylesterase